MCEESQTMSSLHECEGGMALPSSERHGPHMQTRRRKDKQGHFRQRKAYSCMARRQSIHKNWRPLHSVDSARVCVATSLAAGLPRANSAVSLMVQKSPLCSRNGRHVRFNPDPPTVHEIIPYSDIYGIHPRDFVFGRGFHMIPAYQSIPVDVLHSQATGYNEDSAEESDSSEDDFASEDGNNEWVVVRQS